MNDERSCAYPVARGTAACGQERAFPVICTLGETITHGWASTRIVGSLAGVVALLAAFLVVLGGGVPRREPRVLGRGRHHRVGPPAYPATVRPILTLVASLSTVLVRGPQHRDPLGPVPTGSGPPATATAIAAAAAVVGRDAERRRMDAFAERLRTRPGRLVLVGEAGIGKTTLWAYGVERCRAAGARVLVAQPTEDDRDSPGQGLLDLFDRHAETSALDADLPLVERSRWVLRELRALAAEGPVVLAVDDLPWLDDVTARTLRFALRRLADEPVALLGTARTWDADDRIGPSLDRDVDLLDVVALPALTLRRIVAGAAPSLSTAAVAEVGDLAHGNPFFALELARARRLGMRPAAEGSPLAALRRRLAGLPPDTLHLVRLLAVAGPSPLRVLAAASGPARLDDALRPALEADVVTVEHDFVLRFTHALVATAVLSGMHALDTQRLHSALADAVTDPDARAVHRARASDAVDAVVADEVEAAALRLARRGAPRLAADLLGHAARLTPRDDVGASVRRTLARMMQCAAAGDLPTALTLADSLLDDLEPGPLRAEVVTCRVVLDFTGAEAFLRAALDEVPDDGTSAHACLRGRLRGLLGWLLAIHLGRVDEGLTHARAALEAGRAHGDAVLVAQAASAVSTASLLLGRRQPDLVEEAAAGGPEVVRSQLALWPQVLRGREQLWDGHLVQARAAFDEMYRRAVGNGAEFQRPYRLADLAQALLAAGDLEAAGRAVVEGEEAARDSRDDRALCWLAYPGGLVAGLRGDAEAALALADRLDGRAARTGERPRHAMAAHLRGTVAASARDWDTALAELEAGLTVLDSLGYAHPGTVPVLPQAIQAASLAHRTDRVEHLRERLRAQSAGLGSPWADAQLLAADGQLMLLGDEPGAALDALTRSHAALDRLGYRLDAARTGCFVVAAALRAGRRRAAQDVGERVLATFADTGVCGWDGVARELLGRVRGAGDDGLTRTEAEIGSLVTAGLRNREIASRMFVSESTVEAHLTRIYRKLGLRNRAELSVRVAGPGEPSVRVAGRGEPPGVPPL